MDAEQLAAVALAWHRRRKRPAWLDLADCPDPRTGVRASARVWRGVLLELGVSRFEDMPADRAELRAVVDRVRGALPPAKRGRGAPGHLISRIQWGNSNRGLGRARGVHIGEFGGAVSPGDFGKSWRSIPGETRDRRRTKRTPGKRRR